MNDGTPIAVDPAGAFLASAIAGAEGLSVANIDSPTELASLAGSTKGEFRRVYQTVAGADSWTVYAWDNASSAAASSPYRVNGSSGQWQAVSGKYADGPRNFNGALTSLSTITGTQLISNIAIGTAPLLVTSTTVVANLNVSQLLGATWAVPGTIGSTTPNTGKFSTLVVGALSVATTGCVTSTDDINVDGSNFLVNTTSKTTADYAYEVQRSSANVGGILVDGSFKGTKYTSTIATGTAPFTVASTTVVANLNVSQLLGNTWAAPGAIGGTTPAAITCTSITDSGLTSGRVTFAGASGLLSDNSAFTFTAGTTNAIALGSSSRITVTTALTDVSATYGYAGNYSVNVTASAANNSRGFSVSTAKAVQAGVVDTGSHTGYWIEAFRNYSVGAADSSGSLASLHALNVNFGHFDTAAVAPVTTTVIGISANIYYKTGTISSLYGINVAQGQTGGTVTDLRAIYITSFAGTISTLTGLFIADQTAGSTSNYAIQTGQGKISLGDVTDATAVGTAGVVFSGGLTVAKTFGLGAVSAPGSPFDGQFWRDSTQKALVARLDGIQQTVSTAVFTATADATVANTLTETSIIGTGVGTKSLPGNFFVAGKTVRITVQGYLSSTANPTLNIKIKYGSTVLVSTGAVAQVGTPSNKGFCVEAIVTCRTTGATGTVSAQGYWQYSTNVQDLTSTTTTTIDTTSGNGLDVTATWGTAAAGNTITGTVTTVEILN